MPISAQDKQKISAVINQMYIPGNSDTVGSWMGTHDGNLTFYETGRTSIHGDKLVLLGSLISQLSSCYVKIATKEGNIVIVFSSSKTFHGFDDTDES